MSDKDEREEQIEEVITRIANELLDFARDRCAQEQQPDDLRFAMLTITLATAAVGASMQALSKEQYMDLASELWDDLDESRLSVN